MNSKEQYLNEFKICSEENTQFLLILFKTNDMVTIKINERTKAGKTLIETARIMAQKYRGIDILEDDQDLLDKIKTNYQSDLLSEQEKEAFLKELAKLAE